MILEATYKKKVSLAHRKKFAQFFTPETIAEIMTKWLLANDKLKNVLEPAFGLGVFSRFLIAKNEKLNIKGFDVDPVIYNTAKQSFLGNRNIQLYLEDYLFNDWENKYDGIICNPPYFKFHDYENKNTLQEIKHRLKINLSGFTNIYTLFILKSIYQLKDNGRIAYIVPSEFLNSDYGTFVKDYLLKSNVLRHIIIFDFKENVFDDALTTSAILLLAKDKNDEKVQITTINKSNQLKSISELIENYPKNKGEIQIDKNKIDPKIKWRKYYQKQQSSKYKNLVKFSEVAKVVRGIATGANDYFSFNIQKAKKHKIDERFLLPCITKSKDIEKPFFTKDDFEKLKNNNANVFLIDADKKQQDENVLNYIKLGEQQEINKKFLTSKRKPWYKLENRVPPPIWVGVFNRSGLKFIRNEAGIRNLTTFHCIYLVENLFNKIEIDLLFAYLLTDVAKQIFNDNRREYGDGLKKFEPNDLNKAYMLDLSKLGKNTYKKIISTYQDYKISVIQNNENLELIEKINNILKKEYEA